MGEIQNTIGTICSSLRYMMSMGQSAERKFAENFLINSEWKLTREPNPSRLKKRLDTNKNEAK
jgi:hypothetical protein